MKAPTNQNPLKETMTTAELLEINQTQSVSFVFSRLGDRAFKGSTATLVCDTLGTILGRFVCIESGGLDAPWKCE